jgi:pilus assembly protein CpaC
MKYRQSKCLALRTLSLLALLPYLQPLNALQTERALHIAINKSRFIELNKNMDSFTVANPEIADIELLDANHLYILGRHLGSTNVTLNNSKLNLFDTLNIEVTHDIDGLKAKLHELVPSENPGVYSSQGSIVLNGQVSSTEKMDDIISIAKTFLHSDKGKKDEYTTNEKTSDVSVINMMQVGGPQQVMLEVKVAEMNRSLAKNFKVDFSMMGSNGQFSGGGISGNSAIFPTLSPSLDSQMLEGAIASAASVITPFGLFGRFIGHDAQVNTIINASRNQGLIKILAEPTLTTISGQTADFLSGGEFPIPVQKNATGGISVSYKEFGVATKFLPVVLDSGRISLKISVDVSELSNVNAVVAAVNSTQNSFIIPALSKRRANSSVELEDGQTIGLAGLISENLRDNVNKFPGLGEIPVLGQLFTSQEFLKKQTELVIFVTPRLAKPMPTSTPQLPTDHFVEPSDIDFYLLGRTEARVRRTSGKASMGAGGMKGVFGQKP